MACGTCHSLLAACYCWLCAVLGMPQSEAGKAVAMAASRQATTNDWATQRKDELNIN